MAQWPPPKYAPASNIGEGGGARSPHKGPIFLQNFDISLQVKHFVTFLLNVKHRAELLLNSSQAIEKPLGFRGPKMAPRPPA